ncbi:MAG: hypothetical protein WDZ76_09770 [Pseudohongiellaceae bacterium]
MAKKKKQPDIAGTYALCITVGLFLGLGMGPFLDNVLLTMLLGALAGAGAGYYFTRNARRRQRQRG